MTRALVHRGPDDEGFFEADDLSIGFRRLAVIDLETGGQPISLEDGSATIVLNGEIYNFRELRRELEAKGHVFRSRGDVEVVLRLYAEVGIACLERLNGMFALAIWDARTRTLYLARDRFGIKPLYVMKNGETLAFASEVGALRAANLPHGARLDLNELRHYLAYGFLSPIGSPIMGVASLPPASFMVIREDGRSHTTSYWQPPHPAEDSGRARLAAVDLRCRLEEAVERQLVADVPVGVFLSGGLDSSTLSALVRRAGGGPLRTFAVGFDDPGAVSELPAARAVATELASDHHELMMDSADVARNLEEIVGSLDVPLADPTAVPTWYMSRLARERVTVALSGEGADELFGGYPRQRLDVLLDRLPTIGRWLLPTAMRIAGRRPSPRLVERIRRPRSLWRQLDWGRLMSADQISRLTIGPISSETEMHVPYAALANEWLRLAAVDPVNGRLAADREVFLPADLLPKVDRMSMAHSLEVRVPFLDNAVADLVLALPGKLKQSTVHNKYILRSVAADLIPKSVLRRRKQGFDVPIGTWLRGPLRTALRDHLAADTVHRQGLFDAGEVGRLIGDHLAARADHGRLLWALLVLSVWQREAGLG